VMSMLERAAGAAGREGCASRIPECNGGRSFGGLHLLTRIPVDAPSRAAYTHSAFARIVRVAE
jgi:hypothetical protein